MQKWAFAVASLTIRKLDERVKGKLRLRAARHGRSMEEEARHLLSVAVDSAQEGKGLGSAIRQRFASLGPIQLEAAPRGPDRPRAKFE